MTTKKLILPLMMFGKYRGYWHRKGMPVYKQIVTGYTTYKTGKQAGKKKPIKEWVVATKKKKIIVGQDGYYKSGPRKGTHKCIYETREFPYDSVGFYPSENAIFMTINNTDKRRLSIMAEEKLNEWKGLVMDWAKENGWKCQNEPVKVIANMMFYFPDLKTVRDTHNAKKLLMDSLEGTIHNNDMYIIDRTIDFDVDQFNPRIELTFQIKGEKIG